MSTMNENSHVSTSNPLQYDLGRWKLFLEATESSKSFDKPTMLQLVYNLFITLQRCPNTDQPESLGVAVLIRGLKILDKYCKTNKKNVVDCEDLKRIEYYLLASLFHLVESNRNCLCQLSANTHHLWSVLEHIFSQQEQCRVLVLKVFTLVCGTREGTLRVLDQMGTMSYMTTNNTCRLVHLVRLIERPPYASEACLLAVFNLLNQIMANLKLTEQIRILCELDESRFHLEQLEFNLRQSNTLDPSSDVWEAIEHFRSYQVNTLQILSAQFNNTEALRLNDKIKQLCRALQSLEMEKCHLSMIERKLNAKCESLMKQCSRHGKKKNVSTRSIQLEPCVVSAPRTAPSDGETIFSDRQTAASVYDYNMKSIDEMLVRPSVLYPVNDNNNTAGSSNNNNNHNHNHNNSYVLRENYKVNKQREENISRPAPPSTSHHNRPHLWTPSGAAECADNNFKASKYFAYIMTTDDDWENARGQANRSIGSSMTRLFHARNRNNNNKLPPTGDGGGGQNGPHSFASLLSFDNHHQAMSRSSSIASHHQQDLSSSPCPFEITHQPDDNVSIKSTSLPNVYRSNFILRRNNIYLPTPTANANE